MLGLVLGLIVWGLKVMVGQGSGFRVLGIDADGISGPTSFFIASLKALLTIRCGFDSVPRVTYVFAGVQT